MSNSSNPSSPNPLLFDSHYSGNQTQSIPKRIRALLSTPQSNSACSALSTSPYPNITNSRCEGLDLLTMAVLEVDGDRAFDFEAKSAGSEESKREGGEVGFKAQRRTRQKAVPSKFQDSVLQPWKRSTRRSRVKKVKF